MRIDVVTLLPQMIEQMLAYGVIGRALEKQICELACWNPRDFTTDKYKTIDDRPYGGGPGMLMMAEPLAKSIEAAQAATHEQAKVIMLSPQGKKLEQQQLVALSREPAVIFVCGRYEGVDERLLSTHIDEEWSIGDYVLAGGELPALVVIESLIRLLPGALGNIDSARQDSFADGLLDCGHYTRPEEFAGHHVPPVLLSGHHSEIARWRLKQSLGRTWLKRPDLFAQHELSKQEQELLEEFKLELKQELTGD